MEETTEIGPIWAEIDYLPSVHGSALFTSGETQALATATLGTSREANQWILHLNKRRKILLTL